MHKQPACPSNGPESLSPRDSEYHITTPVWLRLIPVGAMVTGMPAGEVVSQAIHELVYAYYGTSDNDMRSLAWMAARVVPVLCLLAAMSQCTATKVGPGPHVYDHTKGRLQYIITTPASGGPRWPTLALLGNSVLGGMLLQHMRSGRGFGDIAAVNGVAAVSGLIGLALCSVSLLRSSAKRLHPESTAQCRNP